MVTVCEPGVGLLSACAKQHRLQASPGGDTIEASLTNEQENFGRRTLRCDPHFSLGGRCAVAHNLRRFFDFGEAFPFDWWITPFDGLIKFLAHPDPDWLYDPAKLDLTANKGSVRHSDLGIRLHHEFPRDRVEGQPINPNFRDAIAMPKARTTRLIKKLLALDTEGENLVFVRERERPDPVDDLMPVLAALYQKAEGRWL